MDTLSKIGISPGRAISYFGFRDSHHPGGEQVTDGQSLFHKQRETKSTEGLDWQLNR